MYNKMKEINNEMNLCQKLYKEGKCTKEQYLDKLYYLSTCAQFLKHSIIDNQKTKSSHK